MILTPYATGLANITFAWMVEQCRPYLAFDDFTNATLANYLQRMREHDIIQKARRKENPGMMGKAVTTISETGKWLGSFFSSNENAAPQEKMVRSYCYSADKVPTYHPAHWTLFRAQDSYSSMYKAISSPQDRTPGTCDDRSTELHTPLNKLGETREWMHPSVRWRQEKSANNEDEMLRYSSEPLAALTYDQKDGVWGWKRETKDKVWIPEWPIEAALEDEDPNVYNENENTELALVDACLDKDEVRSFLREHAAAWKKANTSAK